VEQAESQKTTFGSILVSGRIHAGIFSTKNLTTSFPHYTFKVAAAHLQQSKTVGGLDMRNLGNRLTLALLLSQRAEK
jgi:hypothetical protein